jgi:hypothetical protein
MEQIIRRAAVLVSGVSAALGAFVFIAGQRGYSRASERLSEIYDWQEAQYEQCLGSAAADPASACLLQLARDRAPDVWLEALSESGDWMVWGIVLGVVVPVAIWLLFFAGRWIVTGHLLRRTRSVRATYIPKDSA